MNKKELAAAIAAKSVRIEELTAALNVEAEDFDSKSAEIDTEVAELDVLEAKLVRFEKKDAVEAKAKEAKASVSKVATSVAHPEAKSADAEDKPHIEFPRYASLKNFKSEEDAYKTGLWVLGQVFGKPEYARKAQDAGIQIKSQTEGVNTAGGFAVNPEFSNVIIDLREKYGVFRRYARVFPMNSDTLEINRRISGLTAYFTNETDAITESEKGWDKVSLTAKKLGALAKFSIELAEDAVINIADDLAGEIAYAFSLKEDQCGFRGDGTSTYGGMYGVLPKLLANGTAGHVTAAGTTFASVTLANLNNVVGLLPQYAETPNTAWFVSKAFYGQVMQRLEQAAGGTTPNDIVNGVPQLRFGGYPVVISQVLPTSGTTGQLSAIFGDLSLAVAMGTRRDITISLSDQRYWENDMVGIKGTERFDINVHSVGDSSNAGPVVTLKMA